MSQTEIIAEPGTNEIVITRVFDAPPDVVFAVCSDPKLVPEWWGPRGLRTTVDEMDFRSGGRWRYVHEDADGSRYGFYGVYHSVSPERIVQTFEFEGMPGHVLLETVTFEPVEGGKTRLVDQSVFQSVQDRDGMMSSGMETGATESHDRLAELLAGRTA